MHDVFVSYEKETKTIADNIVNTFEKNGIRCWYAPRDVEGQYAQAIVSAINKSKLFVLILNGKSSRSNHVLNEVETAYKMMDDNGLIILPFKVSNEVLSDAMTYYIKRFHWVDASSTDLSVSVLELLRKAKSLLGIDEKKEEPTSKTRESNKYYQYQDKKEVLRLAQQRSILEEVSDAAYSDVFARHQKPVILDIGSNDGYLTNSLLVKSNAGLVIGLEYDNDAVNISNEQYGSTNLKFYQVDVESDNLPTLLDEILNTHQIKGFDILHISMVLLHLRNPFKTLRTLRRYMNPSGSIIIKDIDDGFNVAYPDPKGLFKHAIEMIDRNPRWGYRQSGRQVFTFLNQLGANDIKLYPIGINTINMNFNQKEALFYTYFGAILADLEYLISKFPDNQKYIEDKNWMIENIEQLESEFHHRDFLFVLGLVTVAQNINNTKQNPYNL